MAHPYEECGLPRKASDVRQIPKWLSWISSPLTLGGTNSSLFKGDIQFNPIPSGFQASFWLQTVSGELPSRVVQRLATLFPLCRFRQDRCCDSRPDITDPAPLLGLLYIISWNHVG